MYKVLLFITILIGCTMSNPDKKHAYKAAELNEKDCYPDRKTVNTVDNKEGEIFLIDNVNFGIRYNGDSTQLLPCNLPERLQKSGSKIVFSGNVKETKLEEMWAGAPFVLTKIEEK